MDMAAADDGEQEKLVIGGDQARNQPKRACVLFLCLCFCAFDWI